MGSYSCKCVTCGYNNHKTCRVNGIRNTLNGGRKYCKSYVFEPIECVSRLFPWVVPALVSAITSAATVLIVNWLKTLL